MMARHNHNYVKDNYTLIVERPRLAAFTRSLSRSSLFIAFATMFFVAPSVTYSQAITPTSNCDDSTVGDIENFTGCDRSTQRVEIDTYECIPLDNGAYKWDFVDARHLFQSCYR